MVVGFSTEIFCLMFQFYTITPQSVLRTARLSARHVLRPPYRGAFSLPKSAPTAIPGSKSAPQIFSLISKQIPEW